MKVLMVCNTMAMIKKRLRLCEMLREQGHELVAVAPYDENETVVQEAGFRTVDLPMSRYGTNPLSEFRCFLALGKVFRSEQADVALFFTPKPVTYGSLAARLSGPSRTFSVVNGLGFLFAENRRFASFWRFFGKILYRLALGGNERVFFQNQDDLELFREWDLVSAEQARRVYGSGVDTEFFQPPADPPKPQTFILISRMLRDKGISLFVNAARTLRKRFPQAEFILLGPPYDHPDSISMEQLKAWDAEGDVRYLGTVPDVRPLLGQSEVFVLPSYYREGIPRANLEALAMGKPLITTHMPGCRETVIEGENGFLIQPQDEKALTEAMARFLEDPTLSPKMGEVSRRLAVKQFRLDDVNQIVIDAIEETDGSPKAVRTQVVEGAG